MNKIFNLLNKILPICAVLRLSKGRFCCIFFPDLLFRLFSLFCIAMRDGFIYKKVLQSETGKNPQKRILLIIIQILI